MTYPPDDPRSLTVALQPVDPGDDGRGRGRRLLAALGATGIVVAVVALGIAGRAGPADPARRSPDAARLPSAPTLPVLATLAPPWHPDFSQPSVELYEVIGEAPDVELRSAPVPDDAERLALLVGCTGEGTLRMHLDGVEVDFDCARRFLDGAFVPPLSGQSSLLVEAAGQVRYVVAVRAWSPVHPVFAPPAVSLSAAGTSVPGFAGCGLSFALADGRGGEEQCGPSWMPIPDDRAIPVVGAADLVLTAADGWSISAVFPAVTGHAGIVPAGRDVPPWPHDDAVVDGTSRAVIPALPVGDWGLRLTVTAERDGDRFEAPYYFRVRVGG